MPSLHGGQMEEDMATETSELLDRSERPDLLEVNWKSERHLSITTRTVLI